MNDKQPQRVGAGPVQLAYASLLGRLSSVAIVVLAATFAIYLLHLRPASVPIEEIAAHWHLRSDQVRQMLELPAGWSILHEPGGLLQGDALSYLSIILLSLIPVACLLAASLSFLREKSRAYVVISLLQVAVLLLASSGLLLQ